MESRLVHVVFINGAKGAGKDTFVHHFDTAQFKTLSTGWKPVPVYNLSVVDEIKRIAKESFGWDGRKDENSRDFLAAIKDAWSKFNRGPEFSVVKRIIRVPDKSIVFVHCRDEASIAYIKRAVQGNHEAGLTCTCRSLLIRNTEAESKACGNDADSNVLKGEYNVHIWNDGSMEELKDAAKRYFEVNFAS